MALIRCPECKRSIADSAHSCPECGCQLDDFQRRPKPKGGFTWLWILLGVGGTVVLFGGCCVVGVVFMVMSAANSLPKAQHISTRDEQPPFANHIILYMTFRNNGAAGKILVTISQGGQQWKRIVYLGAGEQRECRFVLQGMRPGLYDTRWEPESTASAAAKSGALQE